jgi:hypothetical protein
MGAQDRKFAANSSFGPTYREYKNALPSTIIYEQVVPDSSKDPSTGTGCTPARPPLSLRDGAPSTRPTGNRSTHDLNSEHFPAAYDDKKVNAE